VGWLTQCGVVTLIYLRTIPQRLGASLTAAVGVGGVVAVMVAVLSIAEGFRATLTRTGSPDTVIVMRSGTDSEMSSVLSLEQTRIIADGPGVRRGADGPMASAELFVIVDLPNRSTGTEANVPLRGVQPAGFEVREHARIVAGRRFEPGRSEILVGVGAARTFSGLDIGRTQRWGDNEWTVVGHFEAGGGLAESELWCDAAVLQPAYRRGATFQSVRAKLESPASFVAFKDALTTDPRLSVSVFLEPEYYAEQSEILYGIITGLGTLVAVLMGIGAVFGAINTMYSAVAARAREIATLRALGFGGGPAVAAVLIESLVLALGGGILGGVAAYVAFNGYRAATLNWSSFSQVVFAFEVTPRLMLLGLLASLVMGLLGGIFPALRAARVSVTVALREL
jgi:putative ABC transport system permease protein